MRILPRRRHGHDRRHVSTDTELKTLSESFDLSVSVIVLTLNEEMNLPACLDSVRKLTGGVVVVDAGSSDRTRSIASEFGATVVEHPFETHSRQWFWALENVP